MKGVLAALDHLDGRQAAALIVDGRLRDLLIDPPEDDPRPVPGQIHRAIPERPAKGMGGVMLRLAGGARGFLRQAKGIAPGKPLLVQVATVAERHKAAPVTTRLMLKGRAAIVTPGAPGRNIARRIRDAGIRAELGALADAVMADAPPDMGLILRSAAAHLDSDAIRDEIAALLDTARAILSDPGREAELLLDAPTAHEVAWRDWTDPFPDQVDRHPGSFADHGLFEMLDALQAPEVALPGGARLSIEPTRALTAVDIDTGGDFSPAAGLKANLAAMRALPLQLRLRGLGGQIVIDPAPMPRKDRRGVEQALSRALREEGTETAILGWTTAGLIELQRKRDRFPLADLLQGIALEG